MQLVPQFQLVPVLPPSQLGLAVRQLQQFGLAGVPIIVQPLHVLSQSSATSSATEQLLLALQNAAMELEKLPLPQNSGELAAVRLRLRSLLLTLTSDSLEKIVLECDSFVEKLLKELLMRCKQVHPVEVWTLLRNKGCQFLGQFQATILQSLILVLRQHAVMPRKNLIELVVEACERNNARVSKTAVGRVVQLLYRSGCFHVSQHF